MTDTASPSEPELSLVVPCYNEAECIPATLPALCAAFARSGRRLELVAVDNGSSDGTGERLEALRARGLPVRIVRIDVNRGYGHGVLAGLAQARAPWVGWAHADGQVDPEDVVRLFGELATTGPTTLGKVCRRFRMDGTSRRVVTFFCNTLMRLLWPGLGSLDVNGSPKIFHRDALRRLQLDSKLWFLDAEILIKARHMGLRVLELNAFARPRHRGVSKVRAAALWEIFSAMLRYRFTAHLEPWKRSLRDEAARDAGLSRSPAP